jgi:hypothetical protein
MGGRVWIMTNNFYSRCNLGVMVMRVVIDNEKIFLGVFLVEKRQYFQAN